MPHMTSLAIVRLSSMGDIVHASFLPHFLKKNVEGLHVDWYVERRFADVLEDNPFIDRHIVLSGKNLGSLFSPRSSRRAYDYIVDIQGLVYSAMLARRLGKNTVGFNARSAKERLAALFYKHKHDIPYGESIHRRNLFLFARTFHLTHDVDQALQNKSPSLYYHGSAPFLDQGEKPILVITATAQVRKNVPPSCLAAFVRQFGKDRKIWIIWKTEEQRKIATSISERIDNTWSHVLPYPVRIGELKALIAEASLVVGGDTGLTHMAWALNRPSLTLYNHERNLKRFHFPTPINRATTWDKLHPESMANHFKF